MGQAEQDLALIIRFVASRCAGLSDVATFASLRCAVEQLTGFTVFFCHDYAMTEGEALLLEKGTGVFELFFNPDHSAHWLNRKRIAHELFHVLKRSPVPISEVFALAAKNNYSEDALANAFAALMEAIRPAVAARKVKTQDELQEIIATFAQNDQKAFQDASVLFSEILTQVGGGIAFRPPLLCQANHPVGDEFFHRDHHNIPVERVWA